jgi:hypothetical protein
LLVKVHAVEAALLVSTMVAHVTALGKIPSLPGCRSIAPLIKVRLFYTRLGASWRGTLTTSPRRGCSRR